MERTAAAASATARSRAVVLGMLVLTASCDRRAALESQPVTSDQIVSAPEQSASTTTTALTPAVVVKIVSSEQFPAVQFPIEEGRWENGDLWVETDGKGGACWGTEYTQSCPPAGGRLTVDISIGTMRLLSDPPPTAHRLVAFARSRFVSARVLDPSKGSIGESVVCEAKAVSFVGRPEVAAFECDVPLQEQEQHLTIEFIDVDGSTWRLAGELPTIPPIDGSL